MSTTPEQKKAFVEAMQQALGMRSAVGLTGGLSPQSAILVIAHGAYESGWGRLPAAAQGFNFWNLTAGPAWTGAVTMAGDTEYKPGVPMKAITQRFRKYNSPVDAVLDYLKFLKSPRYADGLAKLLKGDSSFVVDLGAYRYASDGKTIQAAWTGLAAGPKGGFYTLPIERYTAEFNAVLTEVKSLIGVC